MMITNPRREPMSGTTRVARLGGLLAATLIVASVAAGCSSGGGASITVTEPWARASSAMAAAGAAYMKIENTGSAADALIGASSPAATTVEVHETVAMGSEMPAASDGMGMESPMPSASGEMGGGMMGMQPIARLEIPAGGTVELKPGSYHIMLIGLRQDLVPGDKIEITLEFEKAGEITVTAEVRES
jgi:periplasmic copper chaperone A